MNDHDKDQGLQSRTLNPIATLQVPADTSGAALSPEGPSGGSRTSVSSVCFASCSFSSHASQSDDSDSSDDEDITFRCRDLLRKEKSHDGDITADARASAASLSLSGTILASCHTNGDAYLWDLGRRRIVADFCEERRGPGMALRRMDGSSSKMLYHTRDAQGTVSLHDVLSQRSSIVTEFETHSFTFCTAAPCAGNSSLLVLPTEHECYACVRDVRVSPQSPPVVKFHGANLDRSTETGQDERKHGMLTSVAMSEATGECGRPVVTCGMESGAVFFHDLLMPREAFSSMNAPVATRLGICDLELGNDPVLGIDLTASAVTSTGNCRSFVAIAGMAGDAADLSELPANERGTVAVMKSTFHGTDTTSAATARLRARVSTCEVGGPEDSNRGGKPGVSICRFRPDGRIFGVGGWDKRLRIFDRTGGAAPLAILKGHSSSVTAMDWAPDAQSSGFLATAAGDGRIFIWKCFPT